jgi:uncharacterized repeat protein (TIGR01451 family)
MNLNHWPNVIGVRSRPQAVTDAVNQSRLVRTIRFWPRPLLMSIWVVLLIGAPESLAQQQGSIPALRGVYFGPVTYTAICASSLQGEGFLTITNQVNDNFSGQTDILTGVGGPMSFSGTVDSTGALQGTFEFSGIDISGSGTFTGQYDGSVIPKTLNLTFTGTLLVGAGSATCGLSITFSGMLQTASGGPSADLSITGSASPTPVATGNRITYSLTVANAGPNDATSTLVVNNAPAGTSIVAATSSQGQCVTTPGNASCSLGTVPKGATPLITITADVFQPGGSTVVDSPNVSSNTFDPDLSNNSTTITTAVAGGGLVRLSWNQQQSLGGGSTPAPSNLQANPAAAQSSSNSAESAAAIIAPDDTCTLTGVNVYKSAQPNVQATPANLFSKTPPGSLQANVPVAPAGSSFVVTNLWTCGTAAIESALSNEVDVPPGPTITGIKVTGKLKILGSGFSGQVQIFVDGVGFAKAAALADSTLLIQKGPLTDGTSISDIGTAASVLITVKNGDGGFATFKFKRL